MNNLFFFVPFVSWRFWLGVLAVGILQHVLTSAGLPFLAVMLLGVLVGAWLGYLVFEAEREEQLERERQAMELAAQRFAQELRRFPPLPEADRHAA